MFEKLPEDPFRKLSGSENQNNVFDWDIFEGQEADDYSAISGFEFGAAQNVDNDLSVIPHPGKLDSPSPNDGSVTEMQSHQGISAGPIGDQTHNLTSLGSSNQFVKAAAEMVRQAVMQGDTFEAAMNTTKRSFRQQDAWVFDHPDFKRTVNAVKKTAGLLGPVFMSPALYTSCQQMRKEADKTRTRPKMVLASSMCRTCPMNRGGHCTVMNCPVGGRRLLATNIKQHRKKQAQLKKATHYQDVTPSRWLQPKDDVFAASECDKDADCESSDLKKEAASFLRYVATSDTVDYQRSRTVTASARRPHEQIVRTVLAMRGLRLPRRLATGGPRRLLMALGLNPRDHGDLIPKLARMIESNQDKSAEMYKEVQPLTPEPVSTDPLAESMTTLDMGAGPITAEEVMGKMVDYVAQELMGTPENQVMDIDLDPLCPFE